MNDKIVKRYPLSKQVADQLEEKIEAGEYAVGERIPTEVELMDAFGVSRNTIREAVRALVSAGILVVKQGDGTYVSSPSRFNANMSMKCDQMSTDDIQEARNALEIAIVRFAATRRTQEDLDRITAAFRRRRDSKDDNKENTKADIEFHMAIAQACHNTILIDLYQSILSYLETHIAQKNADASLDTDRIEMLHEELYRAIVEKEQYTANECIQDILSM